MKITFECLKATGFRKEWAGDRWVRRQKTFEETVNPFNKNADGSIKSREQVRASVNAKARAWEAEPAEALNEG